jgi:hypothetical protein
MEIQNQDQVLLEDDVIYESSDRQDNKIIQANFDFDKVDLVLFDKTPVAKAQEATSISTEDILL